MRRASLPATAAVVVVVAAVVVAVPISPTNRGRHPRRRLTPTVTSQGLAEAVNRVIVVGG